MPDFFVSFTNGVTWHEWEDPPVQPDGSGLPGKPSRLNPKVGRNHRYARAAVGQWIEAKATVGGIEGPPDSALGSRLFTAWLAEVPMHYPLGVIQEPGHSAIIKFKPPVAGHYTLVIRRAEGGSVILHVDAG